MRKPKRGGTPPKHRQKRSQKPESNETWLYGIHAVEAALRNDARARLRLVATRNAAQNLTENGIAAEAEILSPDAITKLLPEGAVHQGLALLTEPLPEWDVEDVIQPAEAGAPIILLDQVTDPHNVGAVLRSAAALGARAVITTHRHSPPVTGALAKVATGAVEHLPYIRTQNLARAIEMLKDAGYRIAGLAEEGAAPMTAFRHDGPLALALGAEGKGLRALTRDLCDDLVYLPTAGPISSLNVSNAAAIALYHVALMRSEGE